MTDPAPALRTASPGGDRTLGDLLPAPGERLAPDVLLDRFVGWVTSSAGLSLYPAQEEALLALLEDQHVVLATPTGSGKSLVATFLHYKATCEGKRSIYTCPIKALVNEKFFALCRDFGPERVGMMTGDASINRDAPILCCTAEILASMALREERPRADAVVMDEFHYYGDRERGQAWQVPLLVLEDVTYLLMSATLGDVRGIAEGITRVTGKKVAEVRSATRPVPLDHEYRETPLHETIEELVSSGRAPVYLVNFTQKAAAEQAQNLMSANFSTKEEKERIREAVADVRFDTPYGKDVSRFIRHGIGLHHAGLLPRYRLLVEKLAQGGLLKVVSGTDTLGMGVNIPIRTVLFTQLCKFDGQKTAILSARDFHQIAGRAGRKGFDERGYVVAQAPEHVIENKKLAEKAAAGKKVVKKQPPQKGFVPWDRGTFEKLQTKEPEPLSAHFEPTFGLLLALVQSETSRRGGGYGRLVEMIERTQETPYAKAKLRRRAAERLRTLRRAGLVELRAIEGYRGRYIRPAAALQKDFSLHHTLALFLLDTLPKVPLERETYAEDVLTLCESILENPDVVLWKQLDVARGKAVAEMKARGMEYDERMAELEKVEYPKPLADFVYANFNAFAALHPWVGQENIRPKSIAREMVERYMTFREYVSEYGLERSEGVLLRYLADAYKTLAQTVPESYRDDRVLDVLLFLRATVRGADASLLDEWERMRDPAYRTAAPDERAALAALPPRPARLDDDPRAFAARVRNALHRLLVALAGKRWDEALAALRDPEGTWTAARLEAELAPYFAEHAFIDTRPIARLPHNTLLRKTGERTYAAEQRIVDPQGEVDWVIACAVDLAGDPAEDAPLLELVRIGT